MTELKSILKEASSECFQQWWHCWEKCVESKRDYFESDKVSDAQGMPAFIPRTKVGYFSNSPGILNTSLYFPNTKLTSIVHMFVNLKFKSDL